ncbi:protein HEXIM1, putative [Ixodes scapularis]|uniref:Protein HEXIM1, putative n=1 Tax=Ixodes scapularis TaxID=6945 RepID=B7Q0M5_IXOSC|nr:protein HEXIM1, putative [Ixodes scapularis]|eukprot:XP_002408010.1 protein HEXIM1, putative [Ixodes scapularis]
MGEVEVLNPSLAVVGGAPSTGEEQTTGSATAAGSAPRSVAAPPSEGSANCVGDRDQLIAENPDETRARSGSTGKKKKNRRGKSKKRKWKPYYKLSWEERRELEERESRRANRLRQQMFAHGQPVAPYNTTQFLMEDHCVQEPDFESRNGHHRHREDSVNSVDSSDEFYSSPEDEDDFLQKQFSEAYDDVHAERLSSMSKAELVQEYLLLEDRVEDLEQKLRAARAARVDAHTQTAPDPEQAQKLAVFRDEIRKLADENALVRAQNRALREALDPGPS